MKRMRGDGGWIGAAAEVSSDGVDDPCAQAVADLIGKFGLPAVLECIEVVCDGACDHLQDLDAPIEGITHEDARSNIDHVRCHLRMAREVL